MSQSWNPDEDDVVDLSKIRVTGWLRFLARAFPLAILVFGCLALLLLLRLIERPIHGTRRPWTPHITQFVCRNAFRIMGMGLSVHGGVMDQPGAIVANHSSWLDIFSLNAAGRIYFVSKAEVAKWPGIGWLARATGTVFIERNPRRAKQQKEEFEGRLTSGHKLLFFPEGTSTDGLRVLPFKTTLFAAFFAPELREAMWIQPVTVNYFSPSGEDTRFYGWWGEMDFGTHLVRTLAARKQGRVEVTFHAPIKVTDIADRKQLARLSEEQVRAGHWVQQDARSGTL